MRGQGARHPEKEFGVIVRQTSVRDREGHWIATASAYVQVEQQNIAVIRGNLLELLGKALGRVLDFV